MKTFHFDQAFRPSSFISWHAQLETRNKIGLLIPNVPSDVPVAPMSNGTPIKELCAMGLYIFIQAFKYFYFNPLPLEPSGLF